MSATYGMSVFVSWSTPVSSTNKTDRHDITEILLKVALNTINQTKLNENLYTCIYLYIVLRIVCSIFFIIKSIFLFSM